MNAFWIAVLIAQAVTAVGACGCIVREHFTGKPLRGQLVSRRVIRARGFYGALTLRAYAWTPGLAAWLLSVPFGRGLNHASHALFLAWNCWLCDDWLNTDDDRWRRWREKAAAKLKTFAPVLLRPVERWTPVPGGAA